MSLRIVRRPKARQDIVEIAIYLAERSIEASDAFLEAIQSAFQLLASLPEMGSPRRFQSPRLAGMRMWPVEGYENYLIFYRPLSDGIEVVRVLHAARDIQRILES